MSDILDLWLWPEPVHKPERLRAWTPDETETFPELTDAQLGALSSHDVINGTHTLPLETVWPPALAGWFAARWRRSDRVQLRLSADLPVRWQQLPYEWLALDGQPLQNRLQVWRSAPRTAEPAPLVRPAPVAVLNLWPDDEPIHPLHPLPLAPTEAHCFDGRGEVQTLLRYHQELRVYSALCLIVHGSERLDALPFRLPDHTLWELPQTPLPPLVILLACGDCDGHLLKYATALLERGAKTVLAALGQLDARDIKALLPRLLQGWHAGERIGQTLHTVQTAISWWGKGRLCLLGAGELRMTAVEAQADWPTDRLAERARAGDDAALQSLPPRLTLACFLANGTPSQATQHLRKYLKVEELGASTENRRLLHRLWPFADAWPTLTRLWLIPLLSHLAEQHDHDQLDACRRCLEDLALADFEFTGLYYDWAKAEYRSGRYAQATAVALRGLQGLREFERDPTIPRLLGLLANTLIDLDLPELAQVAQTRRQNLLARQTGADEERFKSLDIEARLALRSGEPSSALMRFKRKRRIAKNDGKDGQRELASLLYASALTGPHPDDSSWFEETVSLLTAHPEPGSGHDDVLYLLRALAAWVWRRGNEAAALPLFAHYLPTLRELLASSHDNGPAGFTLVFLHLHRRDCVNSLDLPGWADLRAALKETRYFLELAIFSRLLDEPPEQTEHWLRHFADERDHTLHGESWPKWLSPDNLTQWLTQRRERECNLLLAAQPPAWDDLVKAGLLPW